MPNYEFFKSSYSGGNPENACVEVARNIPTTVAIRDSKHPTGPLLHLTPPAWATFTTAVKAEEPVRADPSPRPPAVATP
ncbi:DUF397 domain-containing protein [Streptomyces corynorhini]|uniref:DUF397 domain-containing protein n=1 Tax=Streptomyces corynorhini TaxID=2282652 RepID=A0A370B5G2_9ACTN|nr:DUF397 domain-containing protein [Streptomyces corynorhini]RDG35902.1 DUF397 domain-containing protein [Streptomyces corynorhini]